MHEEHTATAKRQHKETIAAILTLRDGNTQVIARPHVEDATIRPSQAPGRVQKSFTFTEGIDDLESSGRSRPPRATLNDFDPVLKKVLDCLFFRQIADRVEEISPAYERTFQWIFHDPNANDKPWSNFIEWLQHGSGCYWINGKAGSGKSTLMKYISHDVRSHRAITQWAGENNFVTASFFLWNMGSSLQKSQSGLLRSLLIDVLDRHQGLIPSAFPALCRYALSHPTNKLVEPSFPELKKAFLNLVNQQSSSLRMCFFIDGIDEYEGDQAELIDLLKEVTSCSPHVKMVLSSRPTPECVEELSEFPSLRLQDLTHDDIQFYVEDKLGKHRNMMNLKLQEPTAATELIAEISSKASGVFLWVMLVVRSLLQGLRNHDRISDLRRRLDELPEGLETLYEHMLRTMTPIYRQQASQLFQIVMASIQVQAQQPLTALQLSYAEQEDPKKAITTPIRLLASAVETSRCEATEARIRSRCCGLVEVQEKRKRRADGVSYNLLQVSFLHKTVVEFLNIERNWSTMLYLNSDQLFDPHVALMSSCLSFAKTADLRQTAPAVAAEGLSDICRSFLVYAVMVEDKTAEQQTAYVDDFERTMSSHSSEISHASIELRHTLRLKSSMNQISDFNKNILFLALRFGLIRYVTEKLDHQTSIARGEQGSVLLREALCQFIFSGTITGELNTYDRSYYSVDSGCQYTPKFWYECVETLLARGTDPNTRLPLVENRPESGEDLCSSWEMVLDLAIALLSVHRKFMVGFEQEDSWSSLFAALLKSLVIHGGEPNAARVSSLYSGSALSIVDRLLTPSWYVQAGSATDLSPACRSATEIARAQLTSLLTERHAAQREWLGGKLITRPPPFTRVKGLWARFAT